MLILMRRPGESIYIGQQVKVTVISTKGNQVRFGFEAPKNVKIDREEIRERKEHQEEDELTS